MSYFMWSAAAVMGLTTGVHLLAGTSDIMTPILNAEVIDPVISGVALVVWHMVSLMLALSTIAIIYLARVQNHALLILVASLQLGFALIFLWYNLTLFSALFAMPQWIAFLLAALLMSASHFKVVRQ
jgi:hypothetical protein